jgi:hypothetical protein
MSLVPEGESNDRTSGPNPIFPGRLKGRCASALVRFWSELDVPEDDTVGQYIIVTLRILKYEGLNSDEAVEWVEDRLQALKAFGLRPPVSGAAEAAEDAVFEGGVRPEGEGT